MLFELYSIIARKSKGTSLRLKYHQSEKMLDYFYRKLEPKNPIRLVDVENFKMYVDIRDLGDVTAALRKEHTYHRQMTNTLSNITKPSMTCVDVGANIGYFTIILSKMVGPTGKVYAFEPDPTNFGLLLRNIELNGCCSNVICERKAVSNRMGTSPLYLNKIHNFGGHSLIGNGSYEYVPVTSLDIYFGASKIDLIKLDVEGSEPEVIQGMRNLINNNPNLALVVEYLPRRGGPLGHIEELFQKGFKLWHINEFQKVTEPITPFLIKMLYGKEVFMNLLIMRRGYVAEGNYCIS